MNLEAITSPKDEETEAPLDMVKENDEDADGSSEDKSTKVNGQILSKNPSKSSSIMAIEK